jgi:GNAT superfamily N-acetyltransferase
MVQLHKIPNKDLLQLLENNEFPLIQEYFDKNRITNINSLNARTDLEWYEILDGNNFVGIACIRFNWITKNSLNFNLLEIKEDCKNKGYGSQVMTAIEGIAKEHDCKRIELQPHTKELYKYYTKFGYTPSEVHKNIGLFIKTLDSVN